MSTLKLVVASRMRILIFVATALSNGARPAPAAAAEIGEAHIDLTRYFATPEAEEAERSALAPKVTELTASLAQAPSGAARLEANLGAAERLLITLHRHHLYLRMRYAIDHADRAAADANREMTAHSHAIDTAVDAMLRRLGKKRFARSVELRPALAKYSFAVDEALRVAAHALPPAQEALADKLGTASLDALSELYDKTIRATAFAKLKTPEGLLDVRTDWLRLSTSPDRQIRQAAYQQRLAGYASHESIYAALLADIIRARTALAKAHRYADAPTQVYADRQLTRAEVDACIGAVAAQAEVAKDYDRLRAARIKAATAIDDVRPWDLKTPLGRSIPRVPLAEARPLMLTALAPLGPGYVKRFAELVDPARGRMDIGGKGRERERGGFSLGFPGADAVLFVGDYQGSLDNITEVIHEGGHAIHAQMISDAQVSPLNASGPNWMSEAIAILNGLLLRDHLYRTSSDPQLKLFYLQSLIDELAFQIFTSAEEASLEEALFDGVSAGRVQSGADMDALTLRTLGTYEIWAAKEPALGHLWMLKRLMFEDPLYYINYLYAGLLASQFLSLAQRDPADFARRYDAFLRGGFDAPPRVLLQRTFGIDVPGPAAVADAVAVLRAKIDELKQLYAATPPATRARP